VVTYIKFIFRSFALGYALNSQIHGFEGSWFEFSCCSRFALNQDSGPAQRPSFVLPWPWAFCDLVELSWGSRELSSDS